MFQLVQRYEVSRTTPYLFLSPVVGIALGAAVLGDRLTPEVLLGGALTLADIDELQLAVRATLAAAGRCFLVADLSGMAGLDPVARRRIAEWSRGEDDKVDAVAVHGCSFAMRTLITLTLNAIKLLGRQRSETVFVRDEAAALRWIDAQRAAGAGSG